MAIAPCAPGWLPACGGSPFLPCVFTAGASMEDLEAARVALAATLAASRADVRRLRRNEKKRESAEARAWVLPAHVRQAALLMFDNTGDAEAPVKYLSACGREFHWPERTQDSLRIFVEDMYLAAGTDELNEEVADPRARAVAAKYVREWRVVTWSRVANSVGGVAPSNLMLVEQAEVVRQQLPETMRPPEMDASSSTVAKQFARMLRRRWAGRYGRLPVREPMAPGETRDKASACAVHVCKSNKTYVALPLFVLIRLQCEVDRAFAALVA